MIYLLVRGRIGNQLFQYAYARTIQKEYEKQGRECKIIIDDMGNLPMKYSNSLKYYDLKNVEFVNDHKMLYRTLSLYPAYGINKIIEYREKNISGTEQQALENRYQNVFNYFGLIRCTNDYFDISPRYRNNIIIDGFFQSERFFRPLKDEIINTFTLSDEIKNLDYPNLDEIRNRNTVCISIKVQHNVGNTMYDVCNNGYYERAIQYILDRVDNPLFFICSDNVQYVKENLIDCKKYNVIEQSYDYPVHISLAVMALSKHFIIGNTSFGWWAQYLSQNKNKIVIAPSKWYGNDTPYENIYLSNWITIEV